MTGPDEWILLWKVRRVVARKRRPDAAHGGGDGRSIRGDEVKVSPLLAGLEQPP